MRPHATGPADSEGARPLTPTRGEGAAGQPEQPAVVRADLELPDGRYLLVYSRPRPGTRAAQRREE